MLQWLVISSTRGGYIVSDPVKFRRGEMFFPLLQLHVIVVEKFIVNVVHRTIESFAAPSVFS